MIGHGGLAFVAVGTPLLPDEDSDIREEVKKFVADPDRWLEAPNPNLGGRSPKSLIKDGNDEPVRNLLRSIKYLAIS